ncbi:glycosyl transferase family 1 [Paenibacillus sp. J31TS4]|uniref:glycosyltransferase n=1 Tax=Paenibacillus sp. J31TS4 TaxID=2807195 RepID=UPI001B247628|nr:glycosyltransferase [Paenibacillus sp. J31TS4]GIP39897.1 glycosyl transferase family 1 [Paenibacillus sp. J31TS4]
MKVLHIAWLDNNKSNGVSVIVPGHVKSQCIYSTVALLNCSKIDIRNKEDVVGYTYFSLDDCPDGNISKILGFEKPDIVIFHGIYFFYYFRAAKYLIEQSIPYVITPHGSLTNSAQLKKKYKKIVGNFLFFNYFIKNASALQYLTEREKEDSLDFNINSFVCGNAIELGAIEVTRGLKNDNSFNISYLGRLDPYHKGIDILLEACNRISSFMRGNNIKLFINGPDDNGGRKKIGNIINKYNLEDIVTLGDALYDDQKRKKLCESDLFVLTSRFEGQPLAVLEALSLGVPVLLTPGTNMADDIEKYKCGWKADFSVDGIAEQIINAYRARSERELYTKNALKYIADKYSWSNVSRRAIEEYEKIVNAVNTVNIERVTTW